MSRIKAIGLALVVATLAVASFVAQPAAADPGCCWDSGVCYPVGTLRCMGTGGHSMGYLYRCNPNMWVYTGSRC